MKILQIITQSVLGGAQSVVIELSNALVSDGHELIVLSNPKGSMWESLNAAIKKIECAYFVRNIKPIQDLQSYFFIRKVIKTEKPDIIHLHTSKVGLLGRLAVWPFNTKKTFYTMHGFDQIRVANKKFLPLEILLKNQCSKIIAVSEYDKKNMFAHGIKNTQLIYNAVSDKSIAKKDSAIIDSIKKFANGKKIIITVSRNAKPKRFDLFEKLAQEMPQYSFIWIGNNEAIYTQAENLLCLGEIENAGKYISEADLFVLLSDHEGLPVTIIEALSCSVPVVASNVGGIPEVLSLEYGFSVENNIESLVQTIQDTLSNEKQLEKFKTNARLKYENDFQIATMKKHYIEVFNSVT